MLRLLIHLPQGSQLLYHQFNILMVILLCIILPLLSPLPAAWVEGLNKDGLCSSDVTAAVRAGVASWLLLDSCCKRLGESGRHTFWRWRQVVESESYLQSTMLQVLKAETCKIRSMLIVLSKVFTRKSWGCYSFIAVIYSICISPFFMTLQASVFCWYLWP